MSYGAFDFRRGQWVGIYAGALALCLSSGCTGGDDDGDDTMSTPTTIGMMDSGTAGDDDDDDTAGDDDDDDDDDDDMMDSSGGGDCMTGLSHAADIQPIWDMYCVTACHEEGGEWPTNDLSMDAYDDIVGMPSGQNSLMNYITPGDPDASYLWHKMNGTQIDNGGSGLDMPKAMVGESDPAVVPQADLDTIECWILEGAPM